jgi:hypothetical protein
MTRDDIANAIAFLKRVVTRGHDETELLIRTVEALQNELERKTE